MGSISSGDLYDAYKLVKSFRDGMQKALWAQPKAILNAKKLQDALTEMFNNADSRDIQKKVGNMNGKLAKKVMSPEIH